MSTPVLEAARSRLASAIQVQAPTLNSQRLVYDELANAFDLLVSFSIGAQEAARRGDRVRVHGYLADVGRCFNDARDAYGRIAALAKLGGGQ
jgi:hypothetical protein